MSLDLDDPRIARSTARLEPYAAELLRRAGRHALRLHADVVTPEHLLSTLMEDPECGAHAAVLHAFADPQTISGEALAISPGVMVVASGSTLPFSTRGVRVLRAARDLALAGGAVEVTERDLLASACVEVDDAARTALSSAGLRAQAPNPDSAASPAAVADPAEPLFRRFSIGAKRALSSGNRFAAGLALHAISPAHILLGCLKENEELARTVGLSFSRARLALSGITADESEPPTRSLPPDPGLVEFLAGLPAASNSVTILARYLSESTPELAQILIRQKVTEAFLQRARTAFRDPAGPP